MIRKSPGLAALLLGACSIGNLTFTRTTDHAVVARTTVANGASYLPASVDLGGALATCLDDLTTGLSVAALAATRITGAPRTELQLFARAPDEMGSFLSKLSRDDILRGLASLGPSDFTQGTWNAQATTPGGFPRALVMTWPATPGAATGPETTQALASSAFWGPHFASGLAADLDFCHPKGDVASLQPGGTLHQVVAYNRGACRREVALGDFVSPGNNQLVSEVHNNRAPGVGHHKVRYSILQSAINDPGSALDAPVAQLFLFLLFEASDLLGNATSPVGGTVRYDFELVDGRVTLTPHELQWRNDGVWGPITSEGGFGQPGWHQALTSPDGKMVKRINAQILNNQLLGAQSQLFGAQLTGGNFGCDDSTFARQCGAAADSVASTLGALIRGRRSGNAPMFKDAEIDHLLCALADTASCGRLGTNRDAVLKTRWTCTSSSISQTPYCDMIIPAGRLVASPDALGVVFFDRDDFDSAAYAIEAASPGALCAADAPAPATRSFVSSVIVDP